MTIIDEIRAKLEKYPQLEVEYTATSVEVKKPCESGFSVSCHVHGDEYVISFDAWHEHQHTAEDAITLFSFGLSDKCRLAVSKRGQVEHKWSLQSLQESGWADYSTTALFFFPFWKKKSIEYRQNNVIKG